MTIPPTNSVDPAALDRLRRFGGEKLLTEMVAVFLEHIPVRLDALRVALTHDDRAGIRAACHALKSSCAQLGGMRMSALCAQGEAEASDAPIGVLRALGEEIQAEFGRVTTWLQDQATPGGVS